MPDRSGTWPVTRFGLALAGVAAAPFAFRIALLVDRVGVFETPDWRGFLSDLGVAFAALSLLIVAARVSRVAAVVLALLWTAGHAVNFETVSALAALASIFDLHFFGDATFVLGSGLSVGRPLLASALAVLAVALVWRGLQRLSLRSAAAALVAALLIAAVQWAWPWSDDAAIWRQTDFLAYNARQLLRRGTGGEIAPTFPNSASAMLDVMPELAADLRGELRAPLDRKRRNVLLVVLESVSGGHLASLGADHGRPGRRSLRHLDALARRHLAFSTFITHQRRTNRGLYTILCGELPSLLRGLPKMSGFNAGDRRCLPEILARAGYETVYAQAAPLAFMLKDQFMPRAGFERVYGSDRFRRGYARSHWGVDDRAFLEQAGDLVEELDQGDEPWFLSLLTVGTHHPYIVPPDFEAPALWRQEKAFAYLDVAFSEFLARLEQLGVLEDTLLIVTSDESRGLDANDAFTQNWGFLVAVTPEGVQGRVSEPFGLVDVPLSILDYLGLADEGRHLFGRSLFRRYTSGRFLFFANSNMQFAGFVDPSSHVVQCQRDFTACRKQRARRGRIFSPRLGRLGIDPAEVDLLKSIAARSVQASLEAAPARVFSLRTDPQFRLIQEKRQVVYGTESIAMSRGQWVEMDVEVAASGMGGRVALHHVFKNFDKARLFEHRAGLSAGETLRLRFSYAPDEKRAAFECRLLGRVVEGDGLDLFFRKARVTLHRSGEPPGPGLQVLEDEVVRE